MRFFGKELTRSLISHWKYHFLLLCDLALCLLVVFILLFNWKVAGESAYRYQLTISSKPIYGMELKDPFQSLGDDQDSINKMINDIVNQKDWSVFQCVMEPLLLSYTDPKDLPVPEIFEVGYETGTPNRMNPGLESLKSITLSREAYRLFDIEVSSGTLFTEADYTHREGDPYPVLMGSDYQKYYKIGDVIPCLRYAMTDKIVVIGFIKQGSLLPVRGMDITTLDRWVLFPYLDNKIDSTGKVNERKNEYFFSGAVNIVVNNPQINLQERLNQLTNARNFAPVSVEQWGGSAIKSAEIVSQRNVVLLSALAIVICILSVLSIAILLRRRLERDLANYGTYIVTGLSPWRILTVLAAEILLFSLLGTVPTVWLSYLRYRYMAIPFWQLFCFSCGILTLSYLPAVKIVMRVNLDRIIRRKSE